MLRGLPAQLSVVLCLLFASLNLACCALPIFLSGLIKLLPFPALRRYCSTANNAIYLLWIQINRVIIATFNHIEWHIEWPDALPRRGWYLVIANHQSWLDILVISQLLSQKIPPPRFFLKQQLLWVPFLGLAAWAMDMPFMRRYPHSYLAKHPERRGQDLESTRKACAKFRTIPTTIVNFVEGSRFTKAKQQRRNSRFQHLLPPKAGGIAYSLAAMEDQFEYVLDISIAYPGTRNSNILLQLLRGKISRIAVNIQSIKIDETLSGDYFNDKQYRIQFQHWLNQHWQRKDQWLDRWYNQPSVAESNDQSTPQTDETKPHEHC